MAEAAMPSEHGAHSNNVRLGSKNQRFPKSSHLAATSGVGTTAGGVPHSACRQSLTRIRRAQSHFDLMRFGLGLSRRDNSEHGPPLPQVRFLSFAHGAYPLDRRNHRRTTALFLGEPVAVPLNSGPNHYPSAKTAAMSPSGPPPAGRAASYPTIPVYIERCGPVGTRRRKWRE